MYCITGQNYEVTIRVNDTGAVIENGKFGDARILETPLFCMRLKNIETEENVLVDSSALWESVKGKKIRKSTEFVFENPKGVKDITVFVCAKELDGGIEWTQKVINNNDSLSVMEITYPTPKITGEHMNFFLPIHSGKVIEEAQDKDYAYADYYPHSVPPACSFLPCTAKQVVCTSALRMAGLRQNTLQCPPRTKPFLPRSSFLPQVQVFPTIHLNRGENADGSL